MSSGSTHGVSSSRKRCCVSSNIDSVCHSVSSPSKATSAIALLLSVAGPVSVAVATGRSHAPLVGGAPRGVASAGQALLEPLELVAQRGRQVGAEHGEVLLDQRQLLAPALHVDRED